MKASNSPGNSRTKVTVDPILPANAPILRALELPALYAISNVAELGMEPFMASLQARLNAGLRLVQLREKDLSCDELRALARRAVELVHASDGKMLLNGDVALAQEVGADGVQLTSTQLAELRERPALDWCAASCHSAAELRKAETLGCDFALLSPGAADSIASGCAASGLGKICSYCSGIVYPGVCLGRVETGRYADCVATWCTRHCIVASGLVILVRQFLFALFNPIFLVRPFAQIDEFAAFAAERAEAIVRVPYMFLAASRARDNRWFAHESEQKVRSNGTS